MRISVILTLLYLASTRVEAQELPNITPGTRVRVASTTFVTFKVFEQSRPANFDGTVVKMDTDTLVVKAHGWDVPVSFPLSSITLLQVVRGKKSALKPGMLLGAWVGSIVGAELFLSNDSASAKRTAALEVVSVGVAAGLAGTLFGSLVKINRWESIPTSHLGSLVPAQDLEQPACVSIGDCPFTSDFGR
ncbi:hypothetical protein MJD09_14390 [bacterium]|nr:hypothetical protein [bacterium]